MFSIGALSKRTGVKVPTIRYYEQMGLLEAPERTEGNQRRYSLSGLERLGFIKHARELGFSIEAIASLIDLNGHPNRPCADATRIAQDQLAAVRQKIAQLARLETELDRIASGCEADTAEECYVLSALFDHAMCETDH